MRSRPLGHVGQDGRRAKREEGQDEPGRESSSHGGARGPTASSEFRWSDRLELSCRRRALLQTGEGGTALSREAVVEDQDGRLVSRRDASSFPRERREGAAARLPSRSSSLSPVQAACRAMVRTVSTLLLLSGAHRSFLLARQHGVRRTKPSESLAARRLKEAPKIAEYQGLADDLLQRVPSLHPVFREKRRRIELTCGVLPFP